MIFLHKLILALSGCFNITCLNNDFLKFYLVINVYLIRHAGLDPLSPSLPKVFKGFRYSRYLPIIYLGKVLHEPTIIADILNDRIPDFLNELHKLFIQFLIKLITIC